MAWINESYSHQMRETVNDLLDLILERPFAVRLPDG